MQRGSSRAAGKTDQTTWRRQCRSHGAELWEFVARQMQRPRYEGSIALSTDHCAQTSAKFDKRILRSSLSTARVVVDKPGAERTQDLERLPWIVRRSGYHPQGHEPARVSHASRSSEARTAGARSRVSGRARGAQPQPVRMSAAARHFENAERVRVGVRHGYSP